MYGYVRRDGVYTGMVCGVRVTAHSRGEFKQLARRIDKHERRVAERKARGTTS